MSVETLKLPFRSLTVPNYRRYFVGQIISLSGNWMQIVAEMWLILRLTNSSFVVGLTAALQFLPMLVAGAWGGLLADRMPKRGLLMITQTLMAIPALTLWVLTGTGNVTAPVVLALVFVRGAVNAVDNPARQSFVMEMVGRVKVVNAVSLNSLIVQSARIIGPAIAGTIIATIGVAPCFLINALSFGAMLLALRLIDPDELHEGKRVAREPGQLREALRHVAATPALRVPLAVMALVGTLSFNFQVILPLLARFAFHGTAATYAVLTSAMAIGAVAGALAASTRETIKPGLITVAALGFGIFSLAAAAGADTRPRGHRPRRHRRRERHLRGEHQLHSPAVRGARDARARDGALQHRVPRLDADRRPDHRLARRRRRSAEHARARRGRRARGGVRAVVRAPPTRATAEGCCGPSRDPRAAGPRPWTCCARRTTRASSPRLPAFALAAARNDGRRGRRRPRVRESRRRRGGARPRR